MTQTQFTQHLDDNKIALHNFAMKLTHDHNEAADLVQETAFKAFKGKHTFKVGTSFKSWAFTILKNTFISRYHKRRRRSVVNQPIEDFSFALEAKQCVANSGEQNLKLQDVKGAVNKLSDTSRVPFLLHVDGFKYHEIADKLGIPMGTVKSRINYARTKLRKYLRKYRVIK